MLEKQTQRRLAIYIHWPYCVSKCPYCDFNSGRMLKEIDETQWAEAYLNEIKHYAKLLPDCEIGSIYFGGGTPSLMSVKLVETILQSIYAHWRVSQKAEITLEANPSSAEAEKFAGFRAAGVNRLSLGVQSLSENALEFLGRAHNAAEAKTAIELAAKHFPRYSFDLIYARKDQTPEQWDAELREALAFGAKHMSLYQLSIEPNTQFYKLAAQGNMLVSSEEAATEMYENTLEIMRDAGLPQYEISNFATKGEESRHNLTYWHYEDYIGIGVGAHGRVVINGKRVATENVRETNAWLKQATVDSYEIDNSTAQREALMMGLRLAEGVNLEKWQKKFGNSIYDFIIKTKTTRLKKEGLLAEKDKYLYATAAGLQRLNAILRYLLEINER